MPKFRKKPMVIDAVQLRWDTWNEVCDFAPVGQDGCRGVYVNPETGEWSDKLSHTNAKIGLLIPTLEGDMLAVEGDLIIKGVKGEFYPCKYDIFIASYDPVLPD